MEERIFASPTNGKEATAGNRRKHFGRQTARGATRNIVGNEQWRHENPSFIKELFAKQSPDKSATSLNEEGRNAFARECAQCRFKRAARTKWHHARAAGSEEIHASRKRKVVSRSRIHENGRRHGALVVLLEDVCIGRSSSVRIKHHATLRAMYAHFACGQTWVILKDRSDPSQNRIDARTFAMYKATRSRATQPLAVTVCERDGAVDRMRPFGADPRQSCVHALQKRKCEFRGCRMWHVKRANAAFTKSCCATFGERIWIRDRVDDLRHSGSHERFAARPRSTAVVTRLERHQRESTSCTRTCGGERIHFGMRSAAAAVVAIGDDVSVSIGDHATNHRVRFRTAMPARRHAHRHREQFLHARARE